jgi:hypothetical protein
VKGGFAGWTNGRREFRQSLYRTHAHGDHALSSPPHSHERSGRFDWDHAPAERSGRHLV